MVDRVVIHLSDGQASEHGGLVRKEILRTGSWPVIPTLNGIVKKPLTIIRDGKSDRDRGIISMSEVYENFSKIGVRVPVPLALSDDDHANHARENTGWVERLEIIDNGPNDSRLVAFIRFTEPDIKQKVLRGTLADVSCGIPFAFRSRGQSFGAVLEHLAVTNRPFIDGLNGFSVAASISGGTNAPDELSERVMLARDAITSTPTVRARDVRQEEREAVPLADRLADVRRALGGR